MRFSIAFAGGLACLFHVLTLANCYGANTAQEIINQNLCVCPCGNPKGGKLYLIPSVEQQNWFEAVAYCSGIGMSIASMQDSVERAQLRRFLSEKRYNRQEQFWIGANSLVPGRGLQWALSHRQVYNPEWADGAEPDYGPSKPFCVSIFGNTMSWVGSDCEMQKKKFICEF